MPRSLPWFRLYTEARTDKKLSILTLAERGVWINLLCYAAEQETRGTFDASDRDALAAECADFDADMLDATLAKLVKVRHVIEIGEGRMAFRTFNERQQVRDYRYPSEEPSAVRARVAKSRANHPTKRADVTSGNDSLHAVTGHVTSVTSGNDLVTTCNDHIEIEREIERENTERDHEIDHVTEGSSSSGAEAPGDGVGDKAIPAEDESSAEPEPEPDPDPDPATQDTDLVDAALSALCRDVAHAAGVTLPALALRRLIAQHRGLGRDRLLSEVDLAAVWIADTSRNLPGKRQRKMNVLFLHNWLSKAENGPAPGPATMRPRGKRASGAAGVTQASSDDGPALAALPAGGPPPEPVPPPLRRFSIAGYRESATLWHDVATELRKGMSRQQFETTFGGAHLWLPPKDAPPGEGNAAPLPTLVLHSRFSLEQMPRYAGRIADAFRTAAPKLAGVRWVCAAEVTMEAETTDSEPPPAA